MLGVPIQGPSWIFGDNQSVIISSTVPSSTLKKHWNALSYHRVREAVAAGIINVIHMPGTDNPADVLTKFLPHRTLYRLMSHFIFLAYNRDISDKSEGSVKRLGNGTVPTPSETDTVKQGTGTPKKGRPKVKPK